MRLSFYIECGGPGSGRHPEGDNEAWGDRPNRLYHGTSANEFGQFSDKPTYLTEYLAEAREYAMNPIIGGGRGEGEPRVLQVQATPGKTKDVNQAVNEAIMNDDDAGDVVDQEAEKAKNEGYRYISFQHPSGTGNRDEIRVTVALHPKDDLKISRTYRDLPSKKWK